MLIPDRPTKERAEHSTVQTAAQLICGDVMGYSMYCVSRCVVIVLSDAKTECNVRGQPEDDMGRTPLLSLVSCLLSLTVFSPKVESRREGK